MMVNKSAMEGNEKNALIQKFLILCGVALFFLSWVTFVITPITGDLKVFMASAKQASYISNNLIVGSFKAWELKSVYSRVLAYLIYKIAIIFVPYNTFAFEIVCKALYSILIILFSGVSMKLIFLNDRRRVLHSSILVSLLFMAMHTCCQMQVEMTVSLLILLAFALYLNAIKTKKYTLLKLFASGLLIGTIFYFKSVLILLSVTVVAAICIYKIENKIEFQIKKMFVVVAGSVVMLVITAALIMLINPSEFQDMIDASKFQSTLFSTNISIKGILVSFCYGHLFAICFLPIMMLGVICMIINACVCLHEKNWKLIFFHFIMWLMPALFIMLSNRYFVYHFAAYIFPSFVEIYYLLRHANKVKKTILTISSAVILVWYIVFISVFSTNVWTYVNMNKQAYDKTKDYLRRVNYDTKEITLYLDDGSGGYSLGNPSYLKYFFPLPLQRLPEISTLECHVISMERAMEFEGKYISVYEKWFFDDGKYQELKNKLLEEYDHIGVYYVFSVPHSLNSADASIRTVDLYERK